MSAICCGFGHRNLFCNINAELRKAVEYLITEKGVDTFYTGGMGEFDEEFTNAVREAKVKYKNIRIILIKPYFSNELNLCRNYYENRYDEVIIFERNDRLHPKAAIGKRNRYMIDKSSFIIGCIHRDFGGAYTALKYAKRQGKTVIMIKQN